MQRAEFEHIIETWKDGVPNRRYEETCAFWAPDGEFTVYRAAGNPSDWGEKIVRRGPEGARELFSDFHDACETRRYEVDCVTIDTESGRAAWQVRFSGERVGERIEQELAFMIQMDDAGRIAAAFIWPGNP